MAGKAATVSAADDGPEMVVRPGVYHWSEPRPGVVYKEQLLSVDHIDTAEAAEVRRIASKTPLLPCRCRRARCTPPALEEV